MTTYNPASSHAEEFINDQEILDTIEYAQKNKDNLELMRKVLEKGKKQQGLTHREAALLLECEDEQIIAEMFELAKQIKERIYPTTVSTDVYTVHTIKRTNIFVVKN